MMRKLFLFLIAALMLPLSASAQEATTVEPCVFPTVPPAPSFKAYPNLSYEKTSDPNAAIDLYVPFGITNPPLIIVIHGGGWKGGAQSQPLMDGMAKVLAGRGFAAASLGYRLAQNGDNHFPVAVQDARCAVRWLKSQAQSYGYNPQRIGVLGFSAGGHLAVMLGTTADVGGELDDKICDVLEGSPSVQAVAAYYPPVNLANPIGINKATHDIYTNFLGTDPWTDLALAAQASPVNYVKQGDPPFFIVHGTQDPLVPEAQMNDILDALHKANVPVQYISVAGLGHGFMPFDRHIKEQVQPSTCALMDFLNKNLKQ